MINAYFEWERSTREIDDVFECSVLWYWFACITFRYANHVTVNNLACRAMRLCQTHLISVSPKLKYILNGSRPWCNGYRRRKWTRWDEFKSWTRLIAFHITLIPLWKVWIQLFSLQLWVNCWADWVLPPGWGN